MAKTTGRKTKVTQTKPGTGIGKPLSRKPPVEQVTVDDALRSLQVHGIERFVTINRDPRDLTRILSIDVRESL